MLFMVKNRLGPSLLLLAVVVPAALWLRQLLNLHWSWEIRPELVGGFFLGAAVIGASDALLHGVLRWLLGERYLSRYRALAEYFRPQHALTIIGGGLLAGGEELLFRGVLLEGLQSKSGWP